MRNLYILFISVLFTYTAHAQLGTSTFNIANDDASNYGGTWTTGTDGGTGFGSWTLDSSGGGSYVGSSGVGNPSLALWSNGFGNYSNAVRTFDSPLQKGDTFSVDLGHTTTINGEIYLQLLDDGATVITLKFVGGGSDWLLNDGGSDFGSGQPYSANTSLTFTFTYNENGTYSYTFGSGSGSNYNAGNDISHINGFKFESNNQGSGQNFGINNLSITSKYTITSGTISASGDITVPYLDIKSGGTLNIPSTSSVTVSGNLNNDGALNLTSTSSAYPSLIANTISGSGTSTYHRYVNSNANGNDLVSSPVDSQTWSSFLTANSAALFNDGNTGPTAYLYGPFDKASGAYVTWSDTDTETLTSGVGYRAATSAGTTLAFSGSFSTGTETVGITNSGPSFEEWNLIGNPYPSYISVQDFLNHAANAALLDESSVGIYGYDGDASDGWVIYNLSNTAASTVIAPGQGFFVAAETGGNIEFTPSMRRTGTSDDFIMGRNGELVYVMLELSTATSTYKTDIYFNNNASLGLDPGYDTKVWGGTAPSFSLYSQLVEENTGAELAIQTINPTDLSEVTIPLGVHANEGEQLTFSILDSTIPESVNVYLEDVVANTSTLLNNTDYVLTPATALTGTGRFFLRTSEDALTTIDHGLDSLSIYALNTSKEVVVSGLLDSASVLNLYDLQGRFVLSTELDASVSQNRIDVSSLSGGVYVVTVENNGQQKTQKVIIK